MTELGCSAIDHVTSGKLLVQRYFFNTEAANIADYLDAVSAMFPHFSHKTLCTLMLTMLLSALSLTSVVADDEYGSMYVSDALVHYIRPESGRRNISIIMVPGLNLSSYIYLTTPDGRTGWAQMFAEDGYDVYVINDPDFDFIKGGFSVSPFTVPIAEAPPTDPSSSQSWQIDIWTRWGFGESRGSPYSDTRFPTDDYDIFADNYPYVGRSSVGYDTTIASLLDITGSAWLMAHSAGGPQAVGAALRRPEIVLGFLMIEPTGPPGDEVFPELDGLSLFGVYGDYIDSRNQGNRKAGTEEAARLFERNGGRGEVISLPDDLEIFGNTHLMMQDNNNRFIADLILEWLDPGPPPPPPEVPFFADGFEPVDD